jgi:hypothetical protein
LQPFTSNGDVSMSEIFGTLRYIDSTKSQKSDLLGFDERQNSF